MFESTKPRMTMSSLANLASTSEDDILELVWENGQIHMRGRSGMTQKGHSCISYSLYPSNAQATKNGGDNIHTKRASRSGKTIYSILNGKRPFSAFPGHRDSDLNSTRNNSPLNVNFRHRNESNFLGNSQLDPSTSQRQASDSLSRQRVSSPLHKSNLQEHGSSTDKNTGKPNFSYLQPPSILKANRKSSGATRPTSGAVLSRVEDELINGGKNDNPLEPSVIEPATACGSKSVGGLQNQPDKLPIKAELIPPVAKTKESLPDEHSEAFVTRKRNSHDQFLGQTPLNGKPGTKKFTEPLVASTSICSLGASNDLTYALRRTYEDTEESEYPCENVEEQEGFTKAAAARRSKRTRTAEVHNFSEKRRRGKINKKMRALKELIPNCNKMDKVSMLDEAIQYLKTLQLQLQIMLMGSGVCMPPMMLPHFSPMGAGMGTGIGCSPAQFPTSQVGATALPGIAGPGPQMLGFPISLPHASFIPFLQSVMAPGISGANPLVEHLGSAHPLPNSKDSIQNIISGMKNNANVECDQRSKHQVRQ